MVNDQMVFHLTKGGRLCDIEYETGFKAIAGRGPGRWDLSNAQLENKALNHS